MIQGRNTDIPEFAKNLTKGFGMFWSICGLIVGILFIVFGWCFLDFFRKESPLIEAEIKAFDESGEVEERYLSELDLISNKNKTNLMIIVITFGVAVVLIFLAQLAF